MQQPKEDEQADSLVAADLSGRSWQDIEHVVDGIAKDCRTKGDREADSPEGKHGEKAIEDHSHAGKQDSWQKDCRAAGTHEQGIDEACGKAFDLTSNDPGQHARQVLEESNGG